MHFLQLSLITLILCGCGGLAAAGQNVLVLKDDKDDPCSRFKMRILKPAEGGDYKLRVQKPVEDIDPKMVWNPCPQLESLEARLNIPFTPDYRGKFFAHPPSWTLPPQLMITEQQERLKSMKPELPPAMELMRRRKR